MHTTAIDNDKIDFKTFLKYSVYFWVSGFCVVSILVCLGCIGDFFVTLILGVSGLHLMYYNEFVARNPSQVWGPIQYILGFLLIVTISLFSFLILPGYLFYR